MHAAHKRHHNTDARRRTWRPSLIAWRRCKSVASFAPRTAAHWESPRWGWCRRASCSRSETRRTEDGKHDQNVLAANEKKKNNWWMCRKCTGWHFLFEVAYNKGSYAECTRRRSRVHGGLQVPNFNFAISGNRKVSDKQRLYQCVNRGEQRVLRIIEALTRRKRRKRFSWSQIEYSERVLRVLPTRASKHRPQYPITWNHNGIMSVYNDT